MWLLDGSLLFVENHTVNDSGLDSDLNTFVAYCLFLTTQAVSIDLTARKENTTMKMLYRISQNAYAKILDKNASVLEELKNLNDIYHKQYEKALAMSTDDSLPRNAIKKHTLQSLQYSTQQKRKFDEITSENYFSKDQDSNESIEMQNVHNVSMNFVKIFKKERAAKGMKMNWKLCLGEGKKRFDWKYKNEESLRVLFSEHEKKILLCYNSRLSYFITAVSYLLHMF